MYDIFLSYSSQDRERLQPLVKALEHQGWSVFVDHRAIESGDLWKKKIQKAIHECKSVVAVWSKNSILIDTSTDPISYSIRSEWVDEEVDIAKKRGVLLPIILDEEVASPFGYKNCQTTDFSHWDNRNDQPEFEKLAKKIRVLLEEHERKRIVAEYAEIARQRAELEQRRETLEAQIETARQAEQKYQIQLTQQTEEAQQLVASTQAELTRQTLEFKQQRAELERQLEAAKHAGQSEPELVAAQQRIDELNVELATARKQAHLAEQQVAESAQRLTDEIAANQTAQQQLAKQQAQAQAQQEKLSAQLRSLETQQQQALRQATSDKAELVRQKTALEQQQSELTTLRTRPPVEVEKVVEKLVEKIVVKEVRSPKDKLIGVAIGGILVLVVWGVVGNKIAPPKTFVAAASPHPPATQTPINVLGIEMVTIDAGSYTMGCQDGRDKECDSDEKLAHTVNLSAFELGKTEVTQGQWKAVMGSNPSNFSSCGDTCPVEQVSWDDVQTFIQKLNAQTGKTYRLPSEAEWEYACRAGQNTSHCGGNDINAVAWYSDNSGSKTHPVGGKQANAWGLSDMSGNVWEWVQDTKHSDYNGAPANGSSWEGGVGRVLRGGSWDYLAWYSRAAGRSYNSPSYRLSSVGFRLARTPQ